MWYVDKRLSNGNFITYIQCTADRSNLCFFIHFYYLQIMRTFSRSFYCLLMYIQTFFNDYDVTTLETIHPITFRNYTKHPIKVLRNKNNIMLTWNLFIKPFPALHLNIFVSNVFYKRNIPEIQGTFYVSLLITRRRVFLQKNAARLLNKTVSKI